MRMFMMVYRRSLDISRRGVDLLKGVWVVGVETTWCPSWILL